MIYLAVEPKVIARRGATLIAAFAIMAFFDYHLRQVHKRVEVEAMDVPLGGVVESLTRLDRAQQRLQQIIADVEGDPDERVGEVSDIVKTLIEANRERMAARFLRDAVESMSETLDVDTLALDLIAYYEGRDKPDKPGEEPKPKKSVGPKRIRKSPWKTPCKRDEDGLRWVFAIRVQNLKRVLKHNPREHWMQLSRLTEEAERVGLHDLAAKLEVEQRNVFCHASHW